MESYSQLSVFLVIITSAGLLLLRNWRLCVLALTLQYVGVFVLIGLSWSFEMAVVKLLTGWVSTAVLGLSMATLFQREQTQAQWGNVTLVRLFLLGLVLMVVYSFTPQFLSWEVGIYPQQAYGGFFLIAVSTLQICLTNNPFRLLLGLLSFLSATEVLYSAVEGSVLVAALFVVMHLSLALAGAYLITGNNLEESR